MNPYNRVRYYYIINWNYISDGRSKQAQTPNGRTWGLVKECLVIIPKGQTNHDRIKDRLKTNKTKATILVYIIYLRTKNNPYFTRLYTRNRSVK